MASLVPAVQSAIEMGALCAATQSGSPANIAKGIAAVAATKAAVSAAKFVGSAVMNTMSSKPAAELIPTVQERQIPSKIHAGVQAPLEILTREEYNTLNWKVRLAGLVRFTLFLGAMFFITVPAAALAGSAIAGLNLTSGWYIALGLYCFISFCLNPKLQEHYLMDKLTAVPTNHNFFDPGLSVNRSNGHNSFLFAISSLFTPFMWCKLKFFNPEEEQRFQTRLANN